MTGKKSSKATSRTSSSTEAGTSRPRRSCSIVEQIDASSESKASAKKRKTKCRRADENLSNNVGKVDEDESDEDVPLKVSKIGTKSVSRNAAKVSVVEEPTASTSRQVQSVKNKKLETKNKKSSETTRQNNNEIVLPVTSQRPNNVKNVNILSALYSFSTNVSNHEVEVRARSAIIEQVI